MNHAWIAASIVSALALLACLITPRHLARIPQGLLALLAAALLCLGAG